LLALAALAGCSGGMDIEAMAPDRSIVTGSIAKANDPEVLDQVAIRSAVAEWPQGLPAPEAMPWVNVVTGSSGAITDLGAAAEGQGLCREFSASREAFDGVALYRGRACRGNGPWVVQSLDKS
jgi:hypothetical protein